MNFVLLLLILPIIIIDFIWVIRNDKKTIYIYVCIVALILLVIVVNSFDLIKTSPLEVFIEKMKPLTDFVETRFK